MAASNASKISKALSKIVPPSLGSPKKSIRPTPSPRAQKTSDTVFKKPTEVPKRKVSKTVKEVKKEEPKQVSNTVKEVKAMLALPTTPTRRPPSIPLSPWNADHSEVVRSAPKTETAVGGAKKKLLTPSSKVNKSAASKKNGPSNATGKSPFTNAAKSFCNNVKKTPSTRNVPATSTNITGQMKTPTSVKSLVRTAVTKPVSPPAGTSSSTQSNTASSTSASLDALQNKLNEINETIFSLRHRKPFYEPPLGEIDGQIEKNIHSDKNLLTSEKGGKENNSDNKPLKSSMNNTYAYLNENSGKINIPIKSENVSNPNDQGVIPKIQYNISSFTASSVEKLNYIVDQQTDDSSRIVRSRRSVDRISSPRRSLPGDGDKPWSPFDQTSTRVFERQYVDLADNLFGPYIADDENNTDMRSPRYSF